jgi:hypothetical protein
MPDLTGKLVRSKHGDYPFAWERPNAFLVEGISDFEFAFLSFANGDRIPDGCMQGLFLSQIELIGQLSLFEL